MIDVKICGLTDAAAVAAAVTGGARWLGFVVFPPSPRHVTPAQAGELAAGAGGAETIAVTVDADDALLSEIRDRMRPDWIQLHGAETPPRARAARTFARRGVIKALPVSSPADIAAARAFEGAADMILFDARPPQGASRPGGHGAAFDWRLLNDAEIPLPWLLSGGLSPANLRGAIAASGARAVDVSSGVETAPGVKDANLIARFLAAARG